MMAEKLLKIIKLTCDCGCQNTLYFKQFEHEEFFEVTIESPHTLKLKDRIKNALGYIFKKDDLILHDSILISLDDIKKLKENL
jgi:hypothetical protein